jgi:hypothetical protein
MPHLSHRLKLSVWLQPISKTRSETRGCTKRPGERVEEAKSEVRKYGRIEASEDKRSGKGGSYDLTQSVCQ